MHNYLKCVEFSDTVEQNPIERTNKNVISMNCREERNRTQSERNRTYREYKAIKQKAGQSILTRKAVSQNLWQMEPNFPEYTEGLHGTYQNFCGTYQNVPQNIFLQFAQLSNRTYQNVTDYH